MYEDTDFLPRRPKSGRGARENTEIFAPYEDTDFLPRRKSPDKTEGLCGVYQDTEFLDGRGNKSRRKSPDRTEGLCGVYQDTEFLDDRGRKSRPSIAGGNDTQGFGELYQASVCMTKEQSTICSAPIMNQLQDCIQSNTQHVQPAAIVQQWA